MPSVYIAGPMSFLAKWVGLRILDATTMEPFPTAVCTLEAQLCR